MAAIATRILIGKLGREPTHEEVATKVQLLLVFPGVYRRMYRTLREKEVAAAEAPVQFETDASPKQQATVQKDLRETALGLTGLQAVGEGRLQEANLVSTEPRG